MRGPDRSSSQCHHVGPDALGNTNSWSETHSFAWIDHANDPARERDLDVAVDQQGQSVTDPPEAVQKLGGSKVL